MAAPNEELGRRRSEAESRLWHEWVAEQDKYYLRCEDDTELDEGIPLPPGSRILTWVMPRLLWQMGVVSFSQAMCSKSASKMVSFLLWMLDAAHTANARIIIETLVDKELWDATTDIVAETDRRTAQHTAVEGYRIFIICSRLQMATLCNTLMTHLQRELNAQSATAGKNRRKDRELEDLGPGIFCVDPRRIVTIEDARLAILQINGVVKDNSIDPKEPVTLEFDSAMSTSSSDDATNLVFNAAALDEAEHDIGDVPGAPEATEEDDDESLPKDHLLYPLLLSHALKTTVAQMWGQQNNIPEVQTDQDHYVLENDDGVRVFRPPIRELARSVRDGLDKIRNSALPEFMPNLGRRVRWLEQQLAAIGVYVSLRDMTDEEKEKVLRKRIVNPADCTPIKVDRADYDFGTEDPRMKKHYPVLVAAMRKTQMVRSLYMRTNKMDVYLTSYLPKVLRMLFGSRIPGIPTYLYRIEEEQRALQLQMGPDHLNKSSRLAYKLLASYPPQLLQAKGYSFSSFWVREMVYLLGEMMGQTHTQMVVLLLIFPLMSRVGMINFKWPAPFVTVTSEPGVGKSEMMRGYQACIHASRLWKNGGPSTGQGAVFGHIEGQIATLDEGLSSDTMSEVSTSAFKTALESRETSMTRQVPIGNGRYKQHTEVYRNQGGYWWNLNKQVTGALGDRAIQVSAGVLSGSAEERRSTSERVAGPSRPEEYTAATMILRSLDGHGNRFDRLFLAGAINIDTSMYQVMISTAYTLLGNRFSDKLRVREVAQIEPFAVGHMRLRLSAQWLALTSQRLPSSNVREEDMDRLQELFLLYNSYLTAEDVCRPLWMLTEINMSEQVRMDVVAALRAMVVYDNSAPKLAIHDRRYYETSMAVNDSTAVISLTNGRHGPPTIIQTLKELRRTQFGGAPVVTIVKGIYHVQAAYVHRPQVQTRITKLIFTALREIFNSSVYRQEWALAFDNEDKVVFSSNVLAVFCDITQRPGTGHPILVQSIGSTDRDTLERELTMMALSDTVSFRTNYTGLGQTLSAAVGILHETEQAPPDAHDISPDGGYSQLLPDVSEYKKSKRLWNQVLIVEMDKLMNADMSCGSNLADDIQDVIVNTMATSGSVRKGDIFYEGLHGAGGGASVSISFTESMLEKAKDGLVLKHLNHDKKHYPVPNTHVHVGGWQNGQNDPSDPFWNVIFPRSSSLVKMPQLNCGNVMSVGRAIEENHARKMCGQLAPPHFRSYAAYPSLEITVIHAEITFTFYVSERSPDPVADALFYVDQTAKSEHWFLLGRKDGNEVHFCLSDLFARLYDSDEFDLIFSEDPLTEETPTAKRILSAYDDNDSCQNTPDKRRRT